MEAEDDERSDNNQTARLGSVKTSQLLSPLFIIKIYTKKQKKTKATTATTADALQKQA